MALKRPNPIALDVIGDLTPNLRPQIKELVERIRDVDSANHGWLQNQLEYIKARFGKRRKKKVPWVGASNINVPLTDGIVRRWRPGIAALILDANPVAFFTAREETDLEPARVVEPFFTWLFVEHMQTASELMKLVDLIANRGHAYVREGWRYETDKEARIASAASLFPNGLEDFVLRKQQVQSGQERAQQISPEALVAQKLAEEYDLNPEDEQEGPMLVEAAQKLVEGARNVRLIFEKVIHDRPDWGALDPINTIVEQTGNPETADFFVIIHKMSRDQLVRMAADQEFDTAQTMKVVEAMSDSQRTSFARVASSGGTGGASMRQQISDFMDRRAGQLSTEAVRSRSPRTPVWEVFCKLDLDGDGVRERAKMWYSAEFNEPLATSPYAFPFTPWPITLYKFEPHAERPIDSRGIPELLAELQKLVNAFHNARVDAAQILLAPVFARRSMANDFSQTIQWRPGAIIPVQNANDIQPIQHDLRILTGLLQEEQSNQRLAETFIGTFDATISNLQQTSERRTAAEINAITQLATNVFGLDARLFQEAMGRSFKKIWQLWQEFGPEEVFFRVQGEPQPRLARKSEINLSYDIAPAGTPLSTNKQFLLANMERILQFVLTDQTGRFDGQALLSAYFELIDHKLARRVVRSQEQTVAAQTVMQGAQMLGGEGQTI